MQNLDQMQSALESMKIDLGRLEIAATRVEKALRAGVGGQPDEGWRSDVTAQLTAAIADIDEILR